jgi:hypothetical protein
MARQTIAPDADADNRKVHNRITLNCLLFYFQAFVRTVLWDRKTRESRDTDTAISLTLRPSVLDRPHFVVGFPQQLNISHKSELNTEPSSSTSKNVPSKHTATVTLYQLQDAKKFMKINCTIILGCFSCAANNDTDLLPGI